MGYKCWSMFSLIQKIIPTTCQEKYLHTMMFLPPCLSVCLVYCGLNSAFSGRLIHLLPSDPTNLTLLSSGYRTLRHFSSFSGPIQLKWFFAKLIRFLRCLLLRSETSLGTLWKSYFSYGVLLSVFSLISKISSNFMCEDDLKVSFYDNRIISKTCFFEVFRFVPILKCSFESSRALNRNVFN